MNFRADSAFQTLPNLTAALLLLVLFFSARKRMKDPDSMPYLALEFSCALWNLGESVILMAADRQTVVLGQLIGDLGAYTMGPAVLWIILRLAGHRAADWVALRVLLFGLPIALVLSYLAGLPWLYRDIRQWDQGSVSWSSISFGPLTLPLLAFTNMLLVLTFIMACDQIWRGGYVQRLRATVLLVLVGAGWLVFAIESAAQRILDSVGLAPLAAGIATAVLHAVDRHFSSIDISPLARALVVDSMPDAMIVCTANGQIADFNPAAGALLDVGRASLGRDIKDAIAGLRFDPALEFPAKLTDDRGRVLAVSRSALIRWKETVGQVFVFRDVTAANRLEAELRDATRAAQNAARMQSEFLANMSHEIRTPLNGIVGMNHLLLDAGLNPQQFEYAAIMRDSIESLRVIVNDILDFSKIEAGLMRVDRAPVDALRIVRETVALFEAGAMAKGLEIRIRGDDVFAPLVEGDAVRIRQVLSNLLSNALKFTERGSVQVTIDRVAGDRWEIAVTDTGIGFDPSLAETLFERFVQADSSTTRRHGGAGLGLSISRRLAEMMGGSLTASSRVGEGAVFRLVLPAAAGPLPAQAPVADPRTAPGDAAHFKGRILLAEDNPVNQRLAIALLSQLGCEVEVVADGEAAVERAKGSTWDLIFMDCFMPGVDGYAAAQRIREWESSRQDGARVPIVAITASVLDADRMRCFASGMDAVLAKPIEPSELRRTLSERLDKSSAQDRLNPATYSPPGT